MKVNGLLTPDKQVSFFHAELAQSPYMFKVFLGSLGIKLHKSNNSEKSR